MFVQHYQSQSKGMKKEFHIILKYLYNNPNHKHNLTDEKSELRIFDNKKITYISNELIKRKLVEKHENIRTISINYNGQKFFEKYSNYRFFLLHETLFNIKTKIENITKITLSIISIFGIIWGGTFTYLNYKKDIKVEILTKERDSIKKILNSIEKQKPRSR
jgi:hypothetical protein